MNVSVEIKAGTFSAEVTVTETGPDGISEAITRCVASVLTLVGDKACGEAAASVWVDAG